jgi:mRNA interferase MazF
MIVRGAVYDARLDPSEGSEQAGIRPVIIVSRNAINATSTVVLAVPCSTYRGRRIYPSQALLHAPDGGLDADSVAMAEHVRVLSQTRLHRQRGTLSASALALVERALLIAFDLPGPTGPS